MLDAYEAGWQDWFAAHGLTPLWIAYEELAADPQAALARALAHIGWDEAAAQGIEPPLRKLADTESEAWIARFTSETRG